MPDVQNEFVFQRGFYITELTGKRAKSLKQLLKCIQKVDNESIFYHLYHTLLQHHFAIPVYSNDFAYWLRKELHEDVLAEKFTYVGMGNTCEYGDIEAVRERLVEILKERLKDGSNNNAKVPDDRAFHFVRSRAVILPTKYRAKNLEEFVECLEKIDRGTLFYHFFSSRLKFGKMKEMCVDDFSRWIDEIGYPEIAVRIIAIDPYGYTLEGIRKEIVEIIRRELK